MGERAPAHPAASELEHAGVRTASGWATIAPKPRQRPLRGDGVQAALSFGTSRFATPAIRRLRDRREQDPDSAEDELGIPRTSCSTVSLPGMSRSFRKRGRPARQGGRRADPGEGELVQRAAVSRSRSRTACRVATGPRWSSASSTATDASPGPQGTTASVRGGHAHAPTWLAAVPSGRSRRSPTVDTSGCLLLAALPTRRPVGSNARPKSRKRPSCGRLQARNTTDVGPHESAAFDVVSGRGYRRGLPHPFSSVSNRVSRAWGRDRPGGLAHWSTLLPTEHVRKNV